MMNMAEMLRDAGHVDLADRLDRELVGRNVIPGRWTFQVVEDYARTYYEPFKQFDALARELTGGYEHLYEAGLNIDRRNDGEPDHEATPADV